MGTGLEGQVAPNSGSVVVSEQEGWVKYSDGRGITPTQVKSVKQEITAKMDNKINTCDVYGEVQEQEKRAVNSRILHIGGILEGWHDGNQANKLKLVTESIPQIQRDSKDLLVLQEMTQTKVVLMDKLARNEVLKQSSKLRGTKIWISEELTLTQLKMKATKLAKLKEARKEGKWAVYRDGKALIRDFKSKPKDSQS